MGARTGSGACLDEQDVLELSGQANPDYSRISATPSPAPSPIEGRGAHFLIPSPGDPLLFPMQRVTGETG